MRTPTGMPAATLLMGENMLVVANRRFKAHSGYTTCRAFDNVPHRVKFPDDGVGRLLHMLQCCPKGHPGGDLRGDSPVTERVRQWWMNQATAFEQERS